MTSTTPPEAPQPPDRDRDRDRDSEPGKVAAGISEAPGFGDDLRHVELRAPGLRPWGPTPVVVALILLTAFGVGRWVEPAWVVQSRILDAQLDDAGRPFTIERDQRRYLDDAVPVSDAAVTAERLSALPFDQQADAVTQELVYEPADDAAAVGGRRYLERRATRHWGLWSLLPAAAAIGLCLLTKEPLTALFGGVLAGALILRLYNLPQDVLLPTLMSPDVAEVILLYCGLLGGLLGVWSRSGAARAFALWAAGRFVRGPRTAKLVGWALGMIFFQGGTISAVMVGTTVRPLTDREKVSHEELSFIVDSTASPVAATLAFNAWPAYVQALIFVPGVAFLATEADRLSFFFRSIPLSFYAILIILGTLLLSVDKAPFLGRRFHAAIKRSRETGALDAPGAVPLSAKELEEDRPPAGFVPSMWDFLIPLGCLIGIALGTFLASGSPDVVWAFLVAFLLAGAMVLARGLSLGELVDGMGQGMKGVVVAGVILVLAVTLGQLSKDAGGGAYLVALLGEAMPYWLLPAALVVLTMVISFSTGTSWGTYAVAFPLGLPLAWAIAESQGLAHAELYMMVCFAAVMNGGLFGDHTSPISDTTVLSAMVSGADLMDHMRTQLAPALASMALATAGWTALAFYAAG